ncbi:diguanylate cyclase [Ideonella sp. DXS29W]|uniref:Diguanylate cyclase n=1 Tax=Ideonella lacteola TaxID=2984193 RepID=A0ABU9BQM9_9BURK
MPQARALLLFLDASTTTALPAGLEGAGAAVERWPLADISAGDAGSLTAVAGRLSRPGAVMVLDITNVEQAQAALRQLALTLARPALWLALLPAGRDHEAEAWWHQGAFDAVARDDTAAFLRALRRTRARLQDPVTDGPELATLTRLKAQIHAMQASLDNIPAPIFAKDADGVYTGCNQAFVDYLGLPREQIIGKTVFDVAPPHLADVYDQADRQLLASGGRQVYEAQVKWADGNLRDVIFHKAVFHDAHGAVAGQAGAIFDITERKRLESGLRELAQTDPLTGLLNRRCFIERAGVQLAEARHLREAVAVLLFDIDHFKQINDIHGHAAGDAMLRHLANLGRQHLRGNDLFARIGGDEFAIVLGGANDVRAVAARLPSRVAATPLSFDGRELACGISLGAAVVMADDHDIDSALRRADAALYEAKRQGRGRSVVFDGHR